MTCVSLAISAAAPKIPHKKLQTQSPLFDDTSQRGTRKQLSVMGLLSLLLVFALKKSFPMDLNFNGIIKFDLSR